MSKRKSEISRRDFVGVSIGAVVIAGVGCGSSDNNQSGAGGQAGVGGNSPGGGGASSGAGGASTGAGGAATGGASSGAGGAATGGASSGAGGAATGGASTTGAGGTSTGGAKTGTGTGGAAAGGGTTGAGGTATGGKTGAGGTATTGGKTGAGGTATTGGTTATGGTTGGTSVSAKLVGMVRNTDVPTATKRAIELAGGLPNLAGKTVLLKPNLLTATKCPCTPEPEVVRGVIQAVAAAGCTKILIGDSAMSGTAISVMASVGIHTVNQAAATELGITITEVNFGSPSNVKPTGATKWASGMNICKDLFDDGSGNKPYIINIACCKHHQMAVWTMVLKNWYGILATQGDRPHFTTAKANTWAAIAELHLAVKEDFAVLDATKAYLTLGPSSGTLASPGIVVASADAVAAEATGLCILRQYRSAASPAITKDDIENQKIFNTDVNTAMGRALTLNNGWISSRSQYNYAAEGLGADEASIMGQIDL